MGIPQGLGIDKSLVCSSWQPAFNQLDSIPRLQDQYGNILTWQMIITYQKLIK
jgi:hypothetical protein